MKNVITIRIFVFIIIIIGISGCASQYMSVRGSFTGGYYEEKISNNMYMVGFSGNGYTSAERAYDMATMRAADLTNNNGYKYFVLIDDSGSMNEFVTSTGYAMVTSYKPNVKLLAVMFKNKPNMFKNPYKADSVFYDYLVKYKMLNKKFSVRGKYIPDTSAVKVEIYDKYKKLTKNYAIPKFYNNDEIVEDFEIEVGSYFYWENPVGDLNTFKEIVMDKIEENKLPVTSVRIYNDSYYLNREDNVYLKKGKRAGFVALFYYKPYIDLGVFWDPVKLKNNEFRIRKVKSGTIAENMNLKPEDKLMSVNGRDIYTFDDYCGELLNLKKGETLELVVYRLGELITLSSKI